MHRKKTIFIWAVSLILLVILGWFSFGPGIGQQTPPKTVTVGLVGGSKPERAIWQSVAKTAKEKYGIIVKTKNFTDYNQPNKALKNDELDLNSFQSIAFQNTWNKANHGGVLTLGETYIAPIRLYSKKYHKLNQLPDKATIVVPNDPTNESRALYVLQNAGLIKIRKTQKLVAIGDITQNPHNFKITEVNDEQCGRVVNSVDAAVVNNDFATPAGLGEKETIYVEPIDHYSYKWINIISVKKGKENNPTYKKVVQAFQTAQTKKLYKKYYGSMQVPAWDLKLK